MKVAICTLGCKLNQYEAMAIADSFAEKGFEVVPFEEKADIYIVNTCTVTERSDYKSRQALRRALKQNENACLVAAGCYAQVDPQSLARLDGVKLVIGNNEKFDLAKYAEDLVSSKTPRVEVAPIEMGGPPRPLSLRKFSGHTRAFVKVQDGCDQQCSFCLTVKARGPSRSVEPAVVLSQVARLAEAGHKEVVLTGVDLGSYGEDLRPRLRLADLIEAIIASPEPEKLRLSSIGAADFDPKLVYLITKSPRVCRHFHIPLQSGDDEILGRMRRPYSTELYRGLIQRLKQDLPEACIGADVMVGFPGETEESFKRTQDFIESVPISYLHVFNFSRRKGTEAYDMKDQVDLDARARRSQLLRALGRKKADSFRRSFIGKTIEVLVETKRDEATGLLRSISDNYLKPIFPGPDSLMNSYVKVRIKKVDDAALLGELAPDS